MTCFFIACTYSGGCHLCRAGATCLHLWKLKDVLEAPGLWTVSSGSWKAPSSFQVYNRPSCLEAQGRPWASGSIERLEAQILDKKSKLDPHWSGRRTSNFLQICNFPNIYLHFRWELSSSEVGIGSFCRFTKLFPFAVWHNVGTFTYIYRHRRTSRNPCNWFKKHR